MKPKTDNQQEIIEFGNIIVNMKNLDHPYILKLFESYEDRYNSKNNLENENKVVERKLMISSNRFMIAN